MKKSALLIGDTIVDKYNYLKPTGLSLETPTVKAEPISFRQEFGGAANVAACLSKLGCKVDFVTSISKEDFNDLQDATGTSLKSVFSRTQVKERFYLVRGETYKYLQINRCNVIPEVDISDINFDDYDIVIVSDYRLGVMSERVINQLPKRKTIVQMQVSDSNENFAKYSGFHCIVGNSSEIPHDTISMFMKVNNIQCCVSTAGKDCVIGVSNNREVSVAPKQIKNVKDYHGAGDAFYAGFCSQYDTSMQNLKDSIEVGIEAAKRFLTRDENEF
jgi:bifunctional ADP-heptose synthase (sugar kinase/adenylyltransferase)